MTPTGLATVVPNGLHTMPPVRRGFDTLALTTVEPMSGQEILALREREGISQAVLALHLNVRTKLVSDWERGVKHPSGPSLKLLALIRVKGIGAVA